MFGFLNRPSLASGFASCTVGVMVIAVGTYYGFSGLRLAMIGVRDIPTGIMTSSGLVLLIGGAALLGLGVSAVERFERKLLISIASRGRYDG